MAAVGSTEQVRVDVKEYYGQTLQCSSDLKTSACTITGKLKMKKSVRQALADVHDEVKASFYGCGLTIPSHIEGCRILDLGSGSGQDCFAISKLVGAKGSVVGVDMTDKQLAIAYKFEDYHREKFGYETKNTEFVKGYIEDLKGAGLKDNDFDAIVSNCVVNLSPDKRAVLRDAYSVLKPGGELYFSDIYTENELPKEVREDKVLWGECLAGALPWKDLISFSKECGFTTPRLVSVSNLDVTEQQAAAAVGKIKFVSATYRMFKLADEKESESACVKYNGSLAEYEQELLFDSKLTFKSGECVEVDQELSSIIQSTRYASLFEVTPSSKKCKGDASTVNIPTDPFSLLAEQKPSEKSGGGCAPTTGKQTSCCTPKESSCAPAKPSGCC